MVYFLDVAANLALNIAGFTGLTDPHQLLIAVVLATAAVLWNSSLVPRWALTAFFTLMGLATTVAIYALFAGRQPNCIYSYDATKPVFADSLERQLSWAEVRKLDCPTLWVARNELYFRGKYCFFTPVAFSYFGNDDTCDPSVERIGSPLGDQNANLIHRMERRKSCPAPMDSCRKLGNVSSSRLELTRQTSKEDR